MSEYRSWLLIAFFITVVFYTVWHLPSNTKYEILSSSNCTKQLPKPSLHALGMRFRTDKSYGHHYDIMYERYLKEYLGRQNFTLLEIGLGCGTPLGVGASAYMWRAYFGAQANIHIIEVDKACGEHWLAKGGSKLNVIMHYGSQSDAEFLRTVIDKVKHFDVAIDDGSHEIDHQIISLRTLLPAVSGNGLYVIEDLLSSYLGRFGGGPIGHKNTTIDILKTLIDDVQVSTSVKWNPTLAQYIYSFEVGPHIVFFRLKKQ